MTEASASANGEAGYGQPAETTEATREESLSYEQARDELADVVRRLEAGGTTLEESLELWERGEKLATVCEQRLQGVRARLEEAMTGSEDPPE